MGNKKKILSRSFEYRSTLYDVAQPVQRLVVPMNYQRTGSDNPKYQSLIQGGFNASNACTIDIKKIVEYRPGSSAQRHKTLKQWHRADAIGVFPTYPFDLSKATSAMVNIATEAASMDAIKRIQKLTQSFNGLNFLGELRETVHMIRHPAAALANATNSFLLDAQTARRKSGTRNGLKLQGKAAVRNFKSVLPELWLEYSFGLAPLLGDIEDMAKASLKLTEASNVKRVTGKGGVEYCLSPSYSESSVLSGIPMNARVYTEDYYLVSCYITAGVKVEQNLDQGLKNLVTYGGFDASQIIPTAWELLPWSFFIDYFSNIGDVLNAHSVDLKNVVWLNKSIRKTCRRRQWSAGLSRPTYVDLETLSDGFCETTWTNTARSTGSLTIPSVSFELPGVGLKLINMAALASVQKWPPNYSPPPGGFLNPAKRINIR